MQKKALETSPSKDKRCDEMEKKGLKWHLLP